MRAAGYVTLLLAAALLVGSNADAGKKRKSRKRASKQTTTEIERLLGKYKWGMSASKVLGLMEKEVRAEFKKRMAAEKEPFKQDQIKREMDDAIKKLKKDHVRFEGKRTSWDVSLVDKEFAHKNSESLVVRWGHRDRKFYFFHKNRLWKVYIAFNATLYRDKTFADFSGMMERRFGAAEQKFKMNLKGEPVLSHLQWPPAGRASLIAIDNTDFYGNFCLAVIDRKEAAKVRDGRRINSPKKRYSDPLVEAVTRKKSKGGAGTDDIVDRITGKTTNAPPAGDTASPSSPAKGSSSGSKGGSKKSGLEGLDI